MYCNLSFISFFAKGDVTDKKKDTQTNIHLSV